MDIHLKNFHISLLFALLSAIFIEDGPALRASNQIGSSVIINEIHYDPDNWLAVFPTPLK